MPDDREHLPPDEIAAILGAFGVSATQSVRELARGSRHSPKLLIESSLGRLVLKRRAAGRDKPERVRQSHRLIARLRDFNLPAPRVLLTTGGASFVERDGRIHELIEFLPGEAYDGSLSRTTAAGEMLARLHAALADLPADPGASRASYHDLRAVRNGLNAIPTVTSGHDSVVGREAELLAATQWMHEQYDAAADEVNAAGFAEWNAAWIHGDWHPGNLLFSGGDVCGILDLDSARIAPAVIDLANGMLQFSILRGGGDPLAWPAYFDEARMRRFLLGYQGVTPVPAVQRRVLPALMVESLIAESVVPIAATGSFGRMPGYGVLMMVARKARWIRENESDLRRWIMD
ncbi:MAG: phosphotransferase [Planctomycetia bacterium]|nr:MAG: phosphotransferase [Planctomycetia bacterium]